MIVNEKRNKPKFVVFDGLDNTGKSTLIKTVKDIFEKEYNCDLVHFPSDELVKKFFNTEKQIKNDRKKFIDALLAEMNDYYSKVQRKDIYFIDRQMISSLLFQGDPGNEEDQMNTYIDELYMEFFNKFEISIHEDILFFVFMEQFELKNRDISQENKKIFDDKIEYYKERLRNLYINIVFNKYDCLNSDNVFNASFMCDDIARTQEVRQKIIIDKISSYFSLVI